MDEEERDEEAAAETEQELSCPYCGETVEIRVDPTGGAQQEYVEDCPVCCQPWQVHVEVDSDGRVQCGPMPRMNDRSVSGHSSGGETTRSGGP